MLAIRLLHSDGCPNYEPTRDLLEKLIHQLGLDAAVESIAVESQSAAERLRFRGSPTVQVDGADIESQSQGAYTLSCRLYGSSGVPSRELIVRALGADQ